MRHKIRCAPALLLTKHKGDKEYILLQHRFNTKILNNTWGVSSCGHLEKGESIKNCIIRETKEEINVSINAKDLNLVNILHAKFGDAEYIMPVFQASKFKGKEKIMEKDKCDELKWFDINNLPDNLSDNRRRMILDYLNGIDYREEGF